MYFGHHLRFSSSAFNEGEIHEEQGDKVIDDMLSHRYILSSVSTSSLKIFTRESSQSFRQCHQSGGRKSDLGFWKKKVKPIINDEWSLFFLAASESLAHAIRTLETPDHILWAMGV